MSLTRPLQPTLMMAVLIGISGCYDNAQSPRVPDSSLAGYWYMGTMTGVDCNLVLERDGTLQIRYGGCFSQVPWQKGTWRRQKEVLLITPPGLAPNLGSVLFIQSYKGNTLLVPQVNVERVAKDGFRKDACFWPNLLGAAGLEISRDANDFH